MGGQLVHIQWLSLAIFLAAYGLNVLYITVFYHRGLAHSGVILSPRLRRFVAATGCLITGIDAKAWACMHRLHHRYSDTEKDPHSPLFGGIMAVFHKQLMSYRKVLVGLIRHHQRYEQVVDDLQIDVSPLHAHRLWYLPYALHFTLGIILSVWLGSAWVGLAYVIGITSHPIQGWAVNALAHSYGYRNFETGDRSRNNTLVAWLVAGEGFQNNHHRFPEAPKFSQRWFEWDWGYQLCLILSYLRIICIKSDPLVKNSACGEPMLEQIPGSRPFEGCKQSKPHGLFRLSAREGIPLDSELPAKLREIRLSAENTADGSSLNH